MGRACRTPACVVPARNRCIRSRYAGTLSNAVQMHTRFEGSLDCQIPLPRGSNDATCGRAAKTFQTRIGVFATWDDPRSTELGVGGDCVFAWLRCRAFH